MSLRDVADAEGRTGVSRAVRALRQRAGDLLEQGTERQGTQRAALFAFAIRIVSAGITYLSQIFLARWMGSFEYGVFVFVWVWVLILGGLSALGLSTSIMRFIPEYREKGETGLLRGVLLHSRLIVVAVSTAAMTMGLAGLYLFGDLVASYYVLPAYLILFCLPAYSLVDIQDGIARGHVWLDAALVPPYIVRPLLILLAMVAAYLAGFPMTATTAAGSAIVACWVTAVLQFAVLRRRLSPELAPGPREVRTRYWLAASAPILLVHGFEFFLQHTDIVILSRYVPPGDVAIYFAALKTIGLVAFIQFAVAAASAQKFSALNARGNREALTAAVRDAISWTFWPSLAGAIAILAVGRPLLWLFGPEFPSAYPVMFVLAAGLLARAAMGPAEFVLNMLGQQNSCAVALSLSAVLNVALNLALIPEFGLMGAAVATASAQAFAAILLFSAARRRLGLNLFIGTRRA